MDRPSNPPAPGQVQTPAHRDIMFCHECSDEWYRDEHGLSCPFCDSDFTEIVEYMNDPRGSGFRGSSNEVGDDGSIFDPDQVLPPDHINNHLIISRNTEEDPDAGHTFNLHATITRTVSRQQLDAGGGMMPTSIGSFISMLTGSTRPTGQAPGPQQQRQGEGWSSEPAQNQNQSAPNESQGQGASAQPHGTLPRVRITTGTTTHDISDFLMSFVTTLGDAPGGVEAHFTRGQDGQGGQANTLPPAPVPLLRLFDSFGLPGGNAGDFVFSEEGLDRIVSHLMEQNIASNAPPPAQPADIENLPRKKVDEAMLGAEHKAECSICMDEVNIGEEVTVLPCKHWFHHACVSAWLREHDTCPHCRMSISQHNEHTSTSLPLPRAQTISGAQTMNRTRWMPGGFDVYGSGTLADPFIVGRGTGAATTGNQAEAESASDHNSMSDRIRRGLFDPQQ